MVVIKRGGDMLQKGVLLKLTSNFFENLPAVEQLAIPHSRVCVVSSDLSYISLCN